jgi:hypothetical protein
VSSPGPTSLVPPGWYVVPDTDLSASSHEHVLLAGEEVNGLDGWDLDRLGWFKMAAGGQAVLRAEGLRQLAARFSPQIADCAGGVYTASFQSGRLNSEDAGGRPVQDLFPFVSGVRVWRRHVELEHRDSPLLSLSLQHRSVHCTVHSAQVSTLYCTSVQGCTLYCTTSTGLYTVLYNQYRAI